jgi:hypothetical protein
VADGKQALDEVDRVTWGITGNGEVRANDGGPPYNLTEQEPYTKDPATLHAVMDAVAEAIEAIGRHC